MEPVFLIRNNFKEVNNVDRLIEDLYERNMVAINLTNNSGSDEEYYNDLFGGKIKEDPKQMAVNRFYKLCNKLETSDVLVIADYSSIRKDPKIGLIKKKSKIFEGTEDLYKLYCFKFLQMENVISISSEKNKLILSSLIPANVTISPVIDKKYLIYNMYRGTPIPFELSSVSDSNLENLCAEYLKSCRWYQSARVLGGTFPDIDIIGYKNENELFVAQVSRAKSKDLIKMKINNLCSFVEAKHKIMFSTNPTDENSNPVNINIQDVWDYFAKDESGKKYLNELIESLFQL